MDLLPASMKSLSALEFEFGIVGDELELSDDESLWSQVSMQAAIMEKQMLPKANFASWREVEATQFQDFLKDLLMELQPNTHDHQARLSTLARLAAALEHMGSFTGATLSTFGSFESNLYTRWADLDLSLELPERMTLPQPISKKVKVKILNALSRTLIRKGEARKLQFIPYARVPLITFEDSQYSISCDISVDNDAAILKSRLLRWICEVDSRCRDLIFLVKFWAKAHYINDPKLGTLNSFALCLLVIFHLQTRSPPVLPPLSSVLDEDIAKRVKGCENLVEEASKGCWEKIQPFINKKFGAQNKSTVAELFVTFINQFSAVKELWSQGLAVCTFSGAWGDRSSTCGKWRSKMYMMAIEDPFDRSENCARSVHYKTFDMIVKAFTLTAEVISRSRMNVGVSSLLECVFCWPVDTQALGLQAWLSKVLSKHRHEQINVRNVKAVQFYQHHNHYNREVSSNILLSNTLDAQFHNQLQLNNLGPPVQKKKKRQKKKLTTTAGANLAVTSSELESKEQSILHLDRIARKANKTKGTRKHAATREGISLAAMDHQVTAAGGSLSGTLANFNVSSVREDTKAQTVERNSITMEGHSLTGGTRALNPKTCSLSQNTIHHGITFSNEVWPSTQRSSKGHVAMEFGERSLPQARTTSSNDAWSAIHRPRKIRVAREFAESLLPQAHTPFVEEKSYTSATKDVTRRGNKLIKGSSTSSYSAGAPMPEHDMIGRVEGASVPTAANHRMRERSFPGRQVYSQDAQVWMPRNMGDKVFKFSSASEGQRNANTQYQEREPLPEYGKAPG